MWLWREMQYKDALIRLIERCRKCFDKRGIIGMMVMDLSKACDCLPHDLFIAKLERVRIDSSYSSWLDIMTTNVVWKLMRKLSSVLTKLNCWG